MDQIEPGAPLPYSPSMEARVAVLEQLALTTQATLERIERGQEALSRDLRGEMKALASDLRGEMKGLASELRGEMGDLRRETHQNFRWLLGIILAGIGGLLGVMAHGFHWL